MACPAAHPEADPLAARLRLILAGLRALVGLWGLTPPVAIAVYNRMGRALARIERMLVRFRAGRLVAGVSRPRAACPASPRAPRQKAVPAPRRFGWLVAAGGYRAACYGSQLQHLLAEPDMVALLEASPQARLVLRPLCRSLAIELPWTVPPARTERIRRPRARRPKPEPFRIPLPRGMISWARREGFGKPC